MRRSLLRAAFFTLTLAGLGACGKDSTGPSGSDTYLDVTNSTSVSIWSVRVRACGGSSWGGDLLESNIIEPGLGQSFKVSPGCLDVKLTSAPSLDKEVIWSNLSFGQGAIVSRTISSWE